VNGRIRSALVRAAILGACLWLALPEAALAQGSGAGTAAQTGGVLDNVIAEIKRSFERVGTRLSDIARAALISLLIIDFVLRAGRAIIGNDSVNDLVRGFAFQIGFVALVWGLIEFIPEFVEFLSRTAIRIAGEAGSPDITASDIVTDGLRRAVRWLSEITVWQPGSVFFVVAAAISVIVLAVTVAMLVVIWAELYLCALAGLVALMFAGLSETRNIAVGYVNALVGKAFKLMGLLIIVAATGEMTTAMATLNGAGFGAAMGMILLQIVSAVLILTLPQALEGLVGGKFSSKSAEMIGKAAQTAATVAGAGALSAGAGGITRAGQMAVHSAQTGGTPGQVAKAALRGLGAGMRDGAVGAGGSAARGQTYRQAGETIVKNQNKGGGDS